MFKAAFPAGEGSNTADTWALEYGKFKNRVSMPKGNHPRLTQARARHRRRVVRARPAAADHVHRAGYRPDVVHARSITAGVATHVSAMATQGWGAVNRSANMRMYGCGTIDEPARVPHRSPDAQSKSYGTGWATLGTLRVLRELSFNTYYWMRSSADGRFVANGATGGDGAVISDLQTDKDIARQRRVRPGLLPG